MQIALVLIVLLLTFPALLLMRGVMGRRIKKLMFRSSEKAAADKLPRHESKEVPAGLILNIEEFNSESVPEEANDARKFAAREAASPFHRSWIYEAAACVAYLLAGSLAGISSDTFYFSAGLALVYFAIITVRYVLHVRLYHQVRGQRPFSGFQHIIGTVILGPLRLIFGTRTQLVPFLIAVAFAVFITVTSESIVAKIAIGIAIVLHVGLRVRLYRQSPVGDNKRLLMLRVFGMDKSAFLTFGYMLDYWRRIGSSFTVVDPSYFRYEHRALSGRNIAIVFWSVTSAAC